MTTPSTTDRPPASSATVATAGLLVVAADLAVIQFSGFPPLPAYALRFVLCAGACGILFLTRRVRPADLGFSVRDWRSDLKWIFRLGWIVLGAYLLLLAAAVIAIRAGWIPDILREYRDFVTPEMFADYLLTALLCAPVVEELVYRGFAVPTLASGFGPRGAIFVSGPVFYLLHLAYGRDPWMLHYLVAGWILGWAYVRCGRLWVPVLLHLLGNVLMGLEDAFLLFFPDLSKKILG